MENPINYQPAILRQKLLISNKQADSCILFIPYSSSEERFNAQQGSPPVLTRPVLDPIPRPSWYESFFKRTLYHDQAGIYKT
jgi:hypothetical protein